MATEILNQVRDNCPHDSEFIVNTLSTKSFLKTIEEMLRTPVEYSYYAMPLETKSLTSKESDILVGFLATSSTTFTLSLGKTISFSKGLKEGEFQFAFCDSVYPLVATPFVEVNISEVCGSGYVVYANVTTEPRLSLGRSNFAYGDYFFTAGMLCTKEWKESPEGKAMLAKMATAPSSPTMLIDHYRASPLYKSDARVRALVDSSTTDEEFLRRFKFYPNEPPTQTDLRIPS